MSVKDAIKAREDAKLRRPEPEPPKKPAKRHPHLQVEPAPVETIVVEPEVTDGDE